MQNPVYISTLCPFIMVSPEPDLTAVFFTDLLFFPSENLINLCNYFIEQFFFFFPPSCFIDLCKVSLNYWALITSTTVIKGFGYKYHLNIQLSR